MWWAGAERPGKAVAFLGGVIGLLASMERISPSRVAKLTTAMIVHRNLPVNGEKLYDWVDSDEGTPGAPPDDKLLNWLLAEHVADSRRWVVWTSLVLGMAAGAVAAFHDVSIAMAGGVGWFLPWQECKDPLVTQGLLLTFAMTVWGGGAGAVVASAVFRRPVLLGATVGAVLGACIAYAGGGQRELVAGFAFFLSTAGVVVALLGAMIVDLSGEKHLL